MYPQVTPHVNEEIWALRPDFVACSIVVRGGRNEATGAHAARLQRN